MSTHIFDGKTVMEDINNINISNDNSKEIKITPPEGYEIDKENSTFDCIKFKPVIKRWRDSMLDAEPECRNATKKQFFNALSDLCKNWKGTIPDHDFQEVLFKFDTEVVMPELKKASWIKIKTRL